MRDNIKIEIEDIYDMFKYYPAITDDEKQDVVLKLYEKICGDNPTVIFESKSHFASYLKSTINNRIIDSKKDKYFIHTRPLSDFDNNNKDFNGEYNSVLLELTSDEPSFFECLEQNDLKEKVLETINKLRPKQKEIMLKLIDGERLVDISRNSDISYETVKSHYYRGVELFKKKWK